VFFDRAALDLSQTELRDDEVYRSVLEGVQELYGEALLRLLSGGAGGQRWILAVHAGIARLLELLALPERSRSQQRALDLLEQTPFFPVYDPRPGEPSLVCFRRIREARRVYWVLLWHDLEGCQWSEDLLFPDHPPVLSHEQSPVLANMAELLEAAGLAWDNEEGLRRVVRGLPNLLIESERRRSVLAHFESGWANQNGFGFPPKGRPPSRSPRTGRNSPGPTGRGAWCASRSPVERLDIQEIHDPIRGRRCYYLLISDSLNTLIYHQVFETPGAINSRAQAALHAIPGSAGPPRPPGPSRPGSGLVPNGNYQDTLQI